MRYLNILCPNCKNRTMLLIKPQGYWCPNCNKIIEDNK